MSKKAQKFINDFGEYLVAQVLESYLVDGKSHRTIQREILGLPAEARGGGFVTMEILHYYNIKGIDKGILSSQNLTKSSSKHIIEAVNIVRNLEKVKQDSESYFSKNNELISTDRMSTVCQRVHQDKLRLLVLEEYRFTCALCEINKLDLLICSHIVPWSVAREHRLNPENAICFCALHDKMFDKGYFSLSSNYEIIFGSKSDDLIKELLKKRTFKKPINHVPDTSLLQRHFDEICNANLS